MMFKWFKKMEEKISLILEMVKWMYDKINDTDNDFDVLAGKVVELKTTNGEILVTRCIAHTIMADGNYIIAVDYSEKYKIFNSNELLYVKKR